MSQSVERLRGLEAACRRHGLPLTAQRRVILDALAERDDHPTADRLLDDVRRRMPEVSRATVYRVLDALVRMGLAVKTCHPGSGAHYDPRTDRHHHLVCTRCERMVDVDVPALDALTVPEVADGFQVDGYSVHFRGLCGDCRTRAARGRPPARRGSPRRRNRPRSRSSNP